MAGSIKKIGKKFRVTLEHGKDHNGKRLRDYKTATTEKEAKAILTDFNYKQQNHGSVRIEKMQLMEFIDYWMESSVYNNCEETTIYGYKNIIKHLSIYFKNIRLQHLESTDIQKYYKHLLIEKKLSANTVHKHHVLLKTVLKFALSQRYVAINVADSVAIPKKIQYEGTPYNIEELVALVGKLKDHKLEGPINIAALLGLRRSEIIGLKWEYVDLEGRVLHIANVRTSAGPKEIIKQPKSKSSRRSLYINDQMYKILINLKDAQSEQKSILGKHYIDSGYVVTKPNGQPYRVNSVSDDFSKFLRKSNLPKIRLHDLRHTFASVLFEKNVPLKSISEALGHSDIAITNKIYAHLYDKTHKETVQIMGSILDQES